MLEPLSILGISVFLFKAVVKAVQTGHGLSEDLPFKELLENIHNTGEGAEFALKAFKLFTHLKLRNPTKNKSIALCQGDIPYLESLLQHTHKADHGEPLFILLKCLQVEVREVKKRSEQLIIDLSDEMKEAFKKTAASSDKQRILQKQQEIGTMLNLLNETPVPLNRFITEKLITINSELENLKRNLFDYVATHDAGFTQEEKQRLYQLYKKTKQISAGLIKAILDAYFSQNDELGGSAGEGLILLEDDGKNPAVFICFSTLVQKILYPTDQESDFNKEQIKNVLRALLLYFNAKSGIHDYQLSDSSIQVTDEYEAIHTLAQYDLLNIVNRYIFSRGALDESAMYLELTQRSLYYQEHIQEQLHDRLITYGLHISQPNNSKQIPSHLKDSVVLVVGETPCYYVIDHQGSHSVEHAWNSLQGHEKWGSPTSKTGEVFWDEATQIEIAQWIVQRHQQQVMHGRFKKLLENHKNSNINLLTFFNNGLCCEHEGKPGQAFIEYANCIKYLANYRRDNSTLLDILFYSKLLNKLLLEVNGTAVDDFIRNTQRSLWNPLIHLLSPHATQVNLSRKQSQKMVGLQSRCLANAFLAYDNPHEAINSLYPIPVIHVETIYPGVRDALGSDSLSYQQALEDWGQSTYGVETPHGKKSFEKILLYSKSQEALPFYRALFSIIKSADGTWAKNLLCPIDYSLLEDKFQLEESHIRDYLLSKELDTLNWHQNALSKPAIQAKKNEAFDLNFFNSQNDRPPKIKWMHEPGDGKIVARHQIARDALQEGIAYFQYISSPSQDSDRTFFVPTYKIINRIITDKEIRQVKKGLCIIFEVKPNDSWFFHGRQAGNVRYFSKNITESNSENIRKLNRLSEPLSETEHEITISHSDSDSIVLQNIAKNTENTEAPYKYVFCFKDDQECQEGEVYFPKHLHDFIQDNALLYAETVTFQDTVLSIIEYPISCDLEKSSEFEQHPEIVVFSAKKKVSNKALAAHLERSLSIETIYYDALASDIWNKNPLLSKVNKKTSLTFDVFLKYIEAKITDIQKQREKIDKHIAWLDSKVVKGEEAQQEKNKAIISQFKQEYIDQAEWDKIDQAVDQLIMSKDYESFLSAPLLIHDKSESLMGSTYQIVSGPINKYDIQDVKQRKKIIFEYSNGAFYVHACHSVTGLYFNSKIMDSQSNAYLVKKFSKKINDKKITVINANAIKKLNEFSRAHGADLQMGHPYSGGLLLIFMKLKWICQTQIENPSDSCEFAVKQLVDAIKPYSYIAKLFKRIEDPQKIISKLGLHLIYRNFFYYERLVFGVTSNQDESHNKNITMHLLDSYLYSAKNSEARQSEKEQQWLMSHGREIERTMKALIESNCSAFTDRKNNRDTFLQLPLEILSQSDKILTERKRALAILILSYSSRIVLSAIKNSGFRMVGYMVNTTFAEMSKIIDVYVERKESLRNHFSHWVSSYKRHKEKACTSHINLLIKVVQLMCETIQEGKIADKTRGLRQALTEKEPSSEWRGFLFSKFSFQAIIKKDLLKKLKDDFNPIESKALELQTEIDVQRQYLLRKGEQAEKSFTDLATVTQMAFLEKDRADAALKKNENFQLTIHKITTEKEREKVEKERERADKEDAQAQVQRERAEKEALQLQLQAPKTQVHYLDRSQPNLTQHLKK